jgi:molybdopterin/thiamine biosynthesis adenylyltransferase
MKDRTFERIQTLFDIALFADVKVLIVGCGSGGGNAALQLVMSGIRNFTLIDNDILGPENVIRHICGRRYIGQKKVDAVADVLLDRSPKADIVKIDADLMTYQGLGAEIAKADVVVLATDNEPTRYMVNELCIQQQTPFVVGRVFTRASAARCSFIVPAAPASPALRLRYSARLSGKTSRRSIW